MEFKKSWGAWVVGSGVVFVLSSAELAFAKGAAQERVDAAVSVEKTDGFGVLADVDPFPNEEVKPVDPVKRKYDQVLVGPAYKARNRSGDFDYYRYVTFYNIERRKERIYALPIQHEDCSDKSELFASYNYSYSFSSTVTSSASLEGLGLSAGFTKARTFSTGRNLRATGDIIADHTPYFIKQNWNGKTYLQTYNSKNKRIGFLNQANPEQTDWYVKVFFPFLVAQYPLDFEAKDADWTFEVERTITGHCSSSD